jgi:hypothetical protein
MKYYYLLLIFVFLLPSCQQGFQQTDALLTLDFGQEPSTAPSGILETAFIKLETNDACFIDKTVTQVESAMGNLFILTGGERKLFVFDRSGKFVALIGNRGGGPGEYLVPTSFSIDCRRNLLSTIDVAQKKIIHYDLKDYRFVSEQRAVYDNFCFEYPDADKIVWKNTDYNSDYAGWEFLVTDTNKS